MRLLYHYKHCSNQMVVSLEFLLPKVSISSPPMHKKEKRNRFHFSFPSSVFVTNLQIFCVEFADIVYNVKHLQNELSSMTDCSNFGSLEIICGVANFASTV